MICRRQVMKYANLRVGHGKGTWVRIRRETEEIFVHKRLGQNPSFIALFNKNLLNNYLLDTALYKTTYS